MARSPERVLDEYLVVLAQGGSRQALDQLVARWTPRLLRHATRLLGDSETAADVVQETWGAALRSLKRLDDPARYPAWLYAIATRKCADSIRAAVRGRKLAASVKHETAIGGGALDPHTDQEIDLAAAIRRLHAGERALVSLFYGEDLSIEEIAEILAAPVGTIKSRLHHARQSLKRHLEGDMP